MFKNFLKRSVGVIVFTFTVLILVYSCSTDKDNTAKIKAAMTEMKASANKLGDPTVIKDSLFFGTTLMNNNFELIDNLHKKYECTATFFVRNGNEFIRISTDVMNEGQRALGTNLDPNGPVIKEIINGKSFYGNVDILGSKYEAGYEPIISKDGSVIGAFYVGYKTVK